MKQNDAHGAASYFVTQVQSVVSHVSILSGSCRHFRCLSSWTANNVIADTAFLHKVIRALTHSIGLLVQSDVKAIAEGVASAFDMEVEVELKQGGYLPVEDNPELAQELMTF